MLLLNKIFKFQHEYYSIITKMKTHIKYFPIFSMLIISPSFAEDKNNHINRIIFCPYTLKQPTPITIFIYEDFAVFEHLNWVKLNKDPEGDFDNYSSKFSTKIKIDMKSLTYKVSDGVATKCREAKLID